MGAIFKREFKAYFTSPMGYVILAIMTLFQGLYFSQLFAAQSADIGFVFSQMVMIMFFIIPILTMRTMSEDRRQKVDQVLITSPVSLYAIVLGKFLATFVIFMLGYGITVLFEIILAAQDVSINILEYIGNLLGVALAGSSLISLGIFISSLTESQLIAAIASFAISLLIYMLDFFSSLINLTFVNKIVEWISFTGRYAAFAEGVIDYSNIVFFLSFSAVFLFLTVRVLDKRRYS